MNARGERIIVFGDSLSKHAHDSSPEIWDVDAGSNRTSSQPGDLLASLLAEQGAVAARVNARVGRSAINFWQRENTQALLESDAAFKPTQVVIVLGTNDLGMSLERDREAMKALRDTYKKMGTEVWAIGPVTYTNDALNAQAEPVAKMMADVFGSRFVDGRPLSVNVGRAGDGVHFTPTSAKPTALAMADALLNKQAVPSWLPFAIGGGIAVAGALVWAFLKGGHKHAYAFSDAPQLGELDGLDGLDGLDLDDDDVLLVQATLDDRMANLKDVAERRKIRGLLDKIDDYLSANIKPTKASKSKKPKAKALPEPVELVESCPIVPKRDALEILSAPTQDAADFLLDRARTCGVSFGHQLPGDRTHKVFLGSLGVDVHNPTVKKTLLGLLRSGKIQLSRADLVAAMDKNLVASSEITDMGATFHFINAPSASISDAPKACPIAREKTLEEHVLPADADAARWLIQRAQRCGTYYGDRQVFLGSLGIDWKDQRLKAALLRMLRDGRVSLVRADLVDDMDPDLVGASQITSLGAQFHFLIVPPPTGAASLGAYRVAYGTNDGHKTYGVLDERTFPTVEGATKAMRMYKRRGMTSWVEDDQSTFVPVPGALSPRIRKSYPRGA